MAKQEKATVPVAGGQEEVTMDLLQKYVSDMVAVEEHIGSAVQRQVKDEKLAKHASQAARLINNIVQMSGRHEQELQSHLQAIGGDTAKGIKEVTSAALGSIAGLYDKVRSEAVSKMVRDDYTALNLATMGYTMLHTTALALSEPRTATLALRHLQEYTAVVLEINEIMPGVVIADLRENGTLIDDKVLLQAVANTQAAWQRHGNDQGASTVATSSGNTTSSKQRTTTKKPAGGANSKASSATPQAATSEKASTSKAKTTTSKSTSSKPAATSTKARSSASKSDSADSKEKDSAANN